MYLRFGNSKLPYNIAIFNMNSSIDCPSRKLGICKNHKICYAKKAEIIYPAVLPFRRKQEIFWDNNNPSIISNVLLNEINKRRLVTKYFRFSESGDFKTQKDVTKMIAVCKELKKHGVKCYGYTARKDLNFKTLQKYATVNGSGFMLSNNFYVVDTIDKSKPFCKSNCKICNLCKKSNKLKIQVKKH